jgi:flagellar biogenesis protein FliO
VSLGEKRFLAVVKVEGQLLLIGGASNSVCLLTRLENPCDFARAFREQYNAHEHRVI